LGFPAFIIAMIAGGVWRLRRKETQRRKDALAQIRKRSQRDSDPLSLEVHSVEAPGSAKLEQARSRT